MLLKTLTLRNYRKYKEASVEFPDGVIGIIGLNGVGKTTLVEAIGWALFGHHAARTTKELIKRNGASQNEPCSVNLEFELEGDQYNVVREMAGKNLVPKASLVLNGKLVTNNADDVTGVLKEKIGMDYQAFFTSVFARQKELNALSVMNAAERKKLVLRMLGIERIEKSIQAIREDKRGKEKRIEGIKAATVDKAGRKKIDVLTEKQKELEQAQEALVPIIKEIESATSRKELSVTAAKEELDLATRTYERYVTLSTKLSERRRDLENTKKRREEKERELADLRVKSKRLEAIADDETRYFQFREQKEKMEDQRGKHQRKLDLMKREAKTSEELQKRAERISELKQKRVEFKGIEEQVGSTTQETESIKNQKERIYDSLGALKSQVLQAKKDREEHTRKKKRIADLGPESECPLCERELGSHYESLLTKLQDELRTKKEELQSVFTEYKRKKEELASAERAEETIAKQAKELDTRVTALHALDTRVTHEERELVHWQTELEQIRADLTPLSDVTFDAAAYKEVIATLETLEAVYREILGLRAEIKRMEGVKNNVQTLHELERATSDDLAALQRRIADLAFNKQDYEEKKARYDRKKEELTESKLKLLEMQNEFENVRRDKAHVVEEIKEQERLQNEKEKEETEILYLNVLEKLMNDFKVYMVGRIRPMLSDYASDMLRRLTDGKYNTMELDENYDIFIYDDGAPYELNRFSGGEEDLANLCLRLAISAVVTERSAIQTNFIILDEVFGSQDAYRKRNIILALNALSKKFRQILLITHIEDVRDYMEYVLRVTEDEEGVSWVRLGE
ncbi:MAG TPA: SMC family ATPase [Desulfobacteria bacterium]|nr:SMC family ATPase [Desulfobacteria bacterium]